jgi:hypothetical protein
MQCFDTSSTLSALFVYTSRPLLADGSAERSSMLNSEQKSCVCPDHFAHERHSSKRKAVKMTEEMKYIVSACLLNDLNLEQISGHLHKEPVAAICFKEHGIT